MYKHILLTTECNDRSLMVEERAKELAHFFNAELSLLHVVDYLPLTDSVYGPVIPFETDFEEQQLESARERMNVRSEKLGIAKERRWIRIGNPKHEIVQIAEEKEVELIVVGYHSRHGLEWLLGSTAKSVLQHIKCDLLVVREE